MGEASEPFKGVFCLPFIELDSGKSLESVRVSFETWGRLNQDRSNVILVCHALTGDAHAGGGFGKAGWWEGVVGPGKAVDTDRYYVICSNVLGGCYGTTGPSSIDPSTGKTYGPRFPMITIRDMVHVQRALLSHLAIDHLHAVVGGSMGGMQALEWAVTYPFMLERCVAIATCARMPSMAIAYNDVMRLAIMNDPLWLKGMYPADAQPSKGLALARMLGMITYRCADEFEERFGRTNSSADPFEMDSRFEVENYLRYQGEKFVRRFDANTMLYMMKAMDLHDIGRDRGGVAKVIERISSKLLLVGIDTDLLYLSADMIAFAKAVRDLGQEVWYEEVKSSHGHDAFLLEFEQMHRIIGPFLSE